MFKNVFLLGCKSFVSKSGRECFIVHTYDKDNDNVIDVFVNADVYSVLVNRPFGETVELAGTVDRFGRPGITINL